MKNILLLLLIITFSQCQSQVEYNRECGNAPPTNRNEKWGTLYWNQEIRIPFIYDKLEGLKGEGAYIAYLDEKAGVIDCDGKEIIPFEYAHLKNWLQPFGKQHGFYVATKMKQTVFGMDENKKEVLNDWGIINEKNKVIIPFDYGYVRIIDANLMVARQDRDSVLYFFSEKGKLLFKEYGKSVVPGSNDLTININQFKGQPSKSIYKSGKEILPKEYGMCYWTDTKNYIVKRDGNQIIIDHTGKQLSPDGFKRLIHEKDDEFFFSYPDSKSKQMGVFRISEGIVLEPKHFLDKWGNIYLAHNESGAKFEVLDKHGNQILPMKKYWTSSSHDQISLKYKEGYKSNFDDFYRVIEDQDIRLKGLINKEGDIILPIKYLSIRFAWKNHPIIAYTQEGYIAFDPKGKQLFSEAFLNILHTRDSNILIVEKTVEKFNTQYGLAQIDKPDEIDYKYKRLTIIGENYLAAMDIDSKDYYLITNDGSSIGATQYTNIIRPEYPFFERFVRTPNTNGNLIAVGVINQKYFGINEKGEEFELVE